jgi:hypothetical protein
MKRKATLCLTTLLLAALMAAWFVPQRRSFIAICLYRIRGLTGTMFFYNSQNGREYQDYYSDGSREGLWKVWDRSGKLLEQCEYRNNYPWDGVCQLVNDKSWLGEYKNGQPWNGYIPKSAEDHYNNHRGKPGSKSIFWGLHTVGIQNTNEDSSVNH